MTDEHIACSHCGTLARHLNYYNGTWNCRSCEREQAMEWRSLAVPEDYDDPVDYENDRQWADIVLAPPRDGRDPDYSRTGIFIYHNCSVCNSGKRPCAEGNSNHCSNPIARNH